MPKSVYFSDDRYEQIVEAAKQCGFRVSRGRGSQLALFVVMASNKALHADGGMRPLDQDGPGEKPGTIKRAGSRRRR